MKYTLAEALSIISKLRKGETFEEYEKRMKKLRRYSNERYDLEDSISVLGDDPRAEKKRKRLEVVKQRISELQ